MAVLERFCNTVLISLLPSVGKSHERCRTKRATHLQCRNASKHLSDQHVTATSKPQKMHKAQPNNQTIQTSFVPIQRNTMQMSQLHLSSALCKACLRPLWQAIKATTRAPSAKTTSISASSAHGANLKLLPISWPTPPYRLQSCTR